MLLSMTGYGDARGQCDTLSYTIEVRSVNNRHLKLTLRAPEPYNLLEAEFDRVVRKTIRRGTVLVQLRIDRQSRDDDFRINPVALQSYLRQINLALSDVEPVGKPRVNELLPSVLSLPGVCVEPSATRGDVEAEWPILEKGLQAALDQLQSMRKIEGGRMAKELTANLDEIRGFLREVKKLQPEVLVNYRDRLRERVQSLLAESKTSVSDDELIREVTLYAERSDVAEEVVRLESHLEQFTQIVNGRDESPGRKLEFVTQELVREANTLGSKAGHVVISRLVVEIKAVLEKIREMIQNVE